MLGRRSALAVVALLVGVAAPARGRAADRPDPAAFLLPPVAAPAADRRPAAADLPLPSRSAGATRDEKTRIRPASLDLPPAARLAAPKDVVPVSASAVDDARRSSAARTDRPPSGEELFDYLTVRRRRDRRDDDAESRSSGRFGGRIQEWGDKVLDTVTPNGRRGFFESDHAFDCFVSPITNPFLSEDPRALTEIRPLFIYQKVPTSQPNFQGGDLWYLGTQARIAFGQRFSLVMTKLGAVATNPKSPQYSDEFGFAELWLGPKYTFIRDEEFGTVAAGGVQFQIPVGSSGAYQHTGDLSIVPYASVGQNFLKTQLGSVNAIANGGYAFSVNNQRSDYFWLSGHLDYDIMNRHRFYPVAELNWFQYTTDGRSQFIKGEGRDLINFGSVAKGSSLLTGALGGRVKLTRSTEFGAAFEIPLAGNRDFFHYRFTVDFIWRY